MPPTSRHLNPDNVKTIPLPYQQMICPVAKISHDKPLTVCFLLGKNSSSFEVTGVSYGDLLSNLDPFQAPNRVRSNTTYICGDAMNQVSFTSPSAASFFVETLETLGYPTICLRRKSWDVITNAPRSTISAALLPRA